MGMTRKSLFVGHFDLVFGSNYPLMKKYTSQNDINDLIKTTINGNLGFATLSGLNELLSCL